MPITLKHPPPHMQHYVLLTDCLMYKQVLRISNILSLSHLVNFDDKKDLEHTADRFFFLHACTPNKLVINIYYVDIFNPQPMHQFQCSLSIQPAVYCFIDRNEFA